MDILENDTLSENEDQSPDLSTSNEFESNNNLTISETNKIVESIEINEDSNTIENEQVSQENTSVTNCLALTIIEDHKLIAVKNVFLKTLRMSWKVAVTSITLALIRLFS